MSTFGVHVLAREYGRKAGGVPYDCSKRVSSDSRRTHMCTHTQETTAGCMREFHFFEGALLLGALFPSRTAILVFFVSKGCGSHDSCVVSS